MPGLKLLFLFILSAPQLDYYVFVQLVVQPAMLSPHVVNVRSSLLPTTSYHWWLSYAETHPTHGYGFISSQTLLLLYPLIHAKFVPASG